MAAEVQKTTGLAAELRVGSSGEFTVWLDDVMVAEKKQGRFPEPAEVAAAIKARLPSSA